MSRAIPLEASPFRAAPLSLRQARERSSILSDLPFFVDPDQEEAIAILKHSPDDKEARWKASIKLQDSVQGITASSGWRGARADESRIGGYNIDYAMLLSGRVTRRTARLPVGLRIGGYQARYETVNDYLKVNPLGLRAKWALAHAAGRARYRIGEGLLEAACALLDHDILKEAEVFYGEGRNSPERLLLRDAVFASEDLTVEEMVRILISAPYEVARLNGDPVPVREEDLEIDDRTPLMFVHCAGISNDLNGRRDIVLEAVDFGTIDTLAACARAMRRRHDEVIRDDQELLFAAKNRATSRATRRR